MNETFRAYLDRLPAESIRAIAGQAGLVPSTLNRQLDGELKVQTVVAICRAFDTDLLEAFVAAGFISVHEAAAMASGSAIKGATDRQLAEEILRRVREAEGSHPDLTNEIGTFSESTTHGEVDEVVGRSRDDLSELTEHEIKSNYATAANSDISAEALDQENS